MELKLSKKITKPDFQGEFTASILAAAASPDIISFAGGLPNPVSFPVEEMDAAVHKVMQEKGAVALQYSNTQGYQPLRAWIAKRYEVLGVNDVVADDIIITNGSQQALEMVGAALIDPGDKILVENPTYLVALQSFHLFDPEVIPVQINPDGIDCDKLQAAIDANPEAKFIYVIPNFQNPTGLTYSKAVRERAAEIFKSSNLLVLEDNPYSELRFAGESGKSFGAYLGEQCCMFGTFSKIVS
ncbi:MAG: PLP-dependent aminotransferase family protein, partial [Oscillospiraceae bacterium]|nr:PLP-dependent aminotransferase family protein [Oscillospiraceae bacterium]